jgi:hypothetical protein
MLECSLQDMPEQPSVLHLLLVRLKPGLSKEDRSALMADAAALASIDGVQHAGAVQASGLDSTHSLALFVFLRDRAALEDFGAHPAHVRFLRRTLAPLLESMASADVSVDQTPPDDYGAACCFCVAFEPQVYDWQVRAYLEQVRSSLGPAGLLCAGPSLDDRQAFRAAGVAFWPRPEGMSTAGPLSGPAAPATQARAVVAGPARRLALPHA